MTRRSSPRTAAALIALFSALGATSSARADQKSDAQTLLDKGNEQVLHGDYLHALESFQSAYGVFPSPKILLNIGTTLRQLGRNAEALDAYDQYLAAPEADEAKKPEVRAIEKLLDAKVGVLHVEVVDTRPAGAPAVGRVLIDAKPAGGDAKTFDVRVDEGPHSVVVEIGVGDDAKTVAKDTAVPGGGEATVHVELRPEPKAETKIIHVHDDTSAADEDRRRARATRRVVGITFLSVGVAGAVIAGVTGGLVLHDKSVVARECPASLSGRCTTQAGVDAAKQGRVLLPVNALGWGLAIVGVGVGIPLVVSGIEPSAPKKSATLRIGPGSLGVEGSF